MHRNVSDALEILASLGIPQAQQNELTALCLLAILDLSAKRKWKHATSPLLGITPIIGWIGNNYGKKYAPNTRETIRKNAMHTFVNAGIVVENPDRPDRPINSPRWVYQIEPIALELLRTYRTGDWSFALAEYSERQPSLMERYANERTGIRIPVRMNANIELSLSPGAHSDLIRAILEDFSQIFVPDGELVYVGDTADKWRFFDKKIFDELGISVNEHGIMPDVVIYCRKRNWLILAEAVTSGGPVDGKRHNSLKLLFKNSSAGLVFVTAFPDGKMMRKFINEIAWETEVWRADAPTHLIHFNGERFLGPYE